ncbi:MAG: STAS/SEC14 domain-containing protein [Pseudomonadota bacterium]
MIEILPQSTDKILAIRPKGVITHEDFEKFTPLLDATVQSGEYIYLLVDMVEFESITPHAMLDDFLLGMKYWWNFEAVAVIGDSKWEEYLTKLSQFVTISDTRFFDPEDSDKAWTWLQGEYAEDH